MAYIFKISTAILLMKNAFINRKEELEFLEKLKDKNFFLVGLSSKAVFYLKKAKGLRDTLLY